MMIRENIAGVFIGAAVLLALALGGIFEFPGSSVELFKAMALSAIAATLLLDGVKDDE